MAANETRESSRTRHPAEFVTTRWSVVLAAGRGGAGSASDAMIHLCRTYWYPLYAYARRRGCPPHDAQDMTQEFFARLLEGSWLASADRQRGRFRSFLLTVMKHFMADEWDKARAQKRGGGSPMLSLDWVTAEERFDLEPVDNSSPDRVFERQWALTLLEEVLNRLEDECRRDGKADLFAGLKHTLAGSSDSLPYAETAARLGLSESAVKVAVHRLRKRYRELIRDEIAGTIDQSQDVEDEMRHLFKVLAEK
jgi:RNA polymerase sigma-70 factor (ECF subfamily)